MWYRKITRKLQLDNRGTFTVEVVFVMAIIIGVILSLLFVIMFCFDRINVECKVRRDINCSVSSKLYEGQLGKGRLEAAKEVDPFCSVCRLEYRVAIVYPFTKINVFKGSRRFM